MILRATWFAILLPLRCRAATRFSDFTVMTQCSNVSWTSVNWLKSEMGSKAYFLSIMKGQFYKKVQMRWVSGVRSTWMIKLHNCALNIRICCCCCYWCCCCCCDWCCCCCCCCFSFSSTVTVVVYMFAFLLLATRLFTQHINKNNNNNCIIVAVISRSTTGSTIQVCQQMCTLYCRPIFTSKNIDFMHKMVLHK